MSLIPVVNETEEKFFTKLTDLFSNNYYCGIYNLANTDSEKIAVLEWQSKQIGDYDSQEIFIRYLQNYYKNTPKNMVVPTTKITVGQYFVFLHIPPVETFMFLPLDEKLRYVPKILNMIQKIKTLGPKQQFGFNNYLINRKTDEIFSWEPKICQGFSEEEYTRLLQVCFIIQLVCNNEFEPRHFTAQTEIFDMVERIDNFMGNTRCKNKYWRILLKPYYVYRHHMDVDLFQFFQNTISQNDKLIKNCINTLSRQVYKLY